MTETRQRADSWGFTEGDALTPDLTGLRRLGGGASYEAWLAFDEVTYSSVVVKLLRPNQLDSSSSRRGLRREVEALARVNHPVVVRGLRHDDDGPRPHVVLEHIEGPRLSTLIRRYGPLQEQQYLPLAIDVASALHYLRHVGWTHLDIKPSNVIMGSPARLIDLSVARPEGDARNLRHPIGTDAYMSPEQCDPGETNPPTHASDVWGLGATLFEAVSGERAFRNGDPDADALVDRFPQVAEEPAALPAGVPGEVVEVITASLQRDPARRPLPHEVVDALEPVLARQPRGSLAGFKVR
ncbi:serine/threonine protein kinase [Nocardioides seonyuensis]|uniref:non-specific serine/threonine protein kinase n=1 Tax=Nocardioides seonyuensis TaxID=2518371 RepID=A0A4V1BMK2_9ACTN|nr:serine/threonine-protein kinase [Nocardioides seonyuensis]QBX56662.1 serine/threonine protein kinase [Nocardioides seonyuensis]